MTELTANSLERWLFLAERATSVWQMCTLLKGKEIESVLVDECGEIISQGMSWEDGAFYGEARLAVIDLVRELTLKQQYIEYVEETIALAANLENPCPQARVKVFPYPEWLKKQTKGDEA